MESFYKYIIMKVIIKRLNLNINKYKVIKRLYNYLLRDLIRND